jgi:dipeptidyl aminopeptidase/acylaminoacyl peptidase
MIPYPDKRRLTMRLSRILPALFCGIALTGAGFAQAGFSLKQVLGAPFCSDLTASPDGKKMAWFTYQEGRRNVWEAESPGFAPRRLTNFTSDDGQELSELTWTPDGRSILFVRGQGTNDAGETPNPAHSPLGTERILWVVSSGGGPARKLGSGDSPTVSPSGQVVFASPDGALLTLSLAGQAQPRPLLHIRGRCQNPAWSPDAKTLVFVTERGDHSYIALYRPATGEVAYVAPGVDRDHTPRWSPRGDRIAFVRQPGKGGDAPPPGADNVVRPWSIMVADAVHFDVQRVWDSGAAPEASIPEIPSDWLRWAAGDRLIFFSEQDGWSHLYSVAASGGTPVLLTPGASEVEQAELSPDRSTIFYTTNAGDPDRRHVWSVSAAGGGVPVRVTGGETIEWQPAPVEGGGVAFLRADARKPGMPYLHTPGAAEPRPISPELLPDGFPTSALMVPQPVLFQAEDGTTIHAQLFAPASGARAGKLPAVVYMHGGPVRQMLLGWHYMFYYHNCYAMNQYLANRGYAVLSVNYRSGIGYGRAFREASGRGSRGAAEYQDIVAACRYLRAREDVDPARIGLWGGSYGGYLTALGLARNSDLFAAGVDLHGVHDWSTRQFRGWSGTESAEVVKRARESSPVASVDTWKSPVLLIHGDDDRNVGFDQTVDLVQRLRARKVPFELVVLPDEVHDFLLHRSWLRAFSAAAEFLERRLK